MLSVNRGKRIGEFPLRNKRTAVGVHRSAAAVITGHAYVRVRLLQCAEGVEGVCFCKLRNQRSRRGSRTFRSVGREIAKAEIVHVLLAEVDSVRNLPGFPHLEILLEPEDRRA